MKTGEVGAVEERFAGRVKAIRDVHGWSAQELSDKLAELGVPIGRPVISKIECRDRRILLNEAAALCEVFGVSVDAMISAEPLRYEMKTEVTL